MRNISDKKGNPAFGLKESYQELMAVTDPAILYTRAVKIMTDHLGHGVSPKNYTKFCYAINQIQHDLTKMQSLVTNFILKADGNGVLYDASRRVNG